MEPAAVPHVIPRRAPAVGHVVISVHRNAQLSRRNGKRPLVGRKIYGKVISFNLHAVYIGFNH